MEVRGPGAAAAGRAPGRAGGRGALGGGEGQSRRGRKRQKQQHRGDTGAPPPQLPPDLVPEAGREEELAARLGACGLLARAAEAAAELGAEDPAVLMSRPLKPLRAALQPYAEAYLDEVAGGPAARASSALWDGRAETALEALRELRAVGFAPRLGSVQRWVRDCMNFGDNAALQTPQAVGLLDAIVRLQPVRWWWQENAAAGDGGAGAGELIHWHPPFEATQRAEPLVPADLAAPAGPSSAAGAAGGGYQGRYGTLARERTCEALAGQFPADLYEVVHHEKAGDRKPRNRYDLDIYALSAGAFRFETSKDLAGSERRVDVPGVPGAFVLPGVLSPHECDQLIAAAEASPSGYVPDEPLSTAPAPDGFSSRAYSFVWLAETVAKRIFERSRPHLPGTLDCAKSGAKVSLSGLNARLRLYRYHPGALYRPHVDGAWPASALRRGEGGEAEYVYDAFEDQRSRLTFLVYLNDDFEGGFTTFYTPGPEEGHLEARRIAPRTGTALVFPHGGDCGSLVHEGSTVSRGAKYVIRTDVLYAAPQRPRT